MSANEDFFRERRAQAVFKHGILSRYPVIFASKTGWGGRPVVFLDGYAGRGEYEDGFPGSPVLLAETATKVASFRGVTGIYVEKDRADFLNLQRVMAKYNRSNDQILCGDLRDHLAKILNDIPGAALFAFLDPFGTALDREQIAGPLLGRHGTAPVEVLLHMSIGTVARLGGLLRRRRQQGVELSVADEKSIDHVDRFLGGTWWWQHFEPVDAADQPLATSAALQVASDYQTSICSETGCRSVTCRYVDNPTSCRNTCWSSLPFMVTACGTSRIQLARQDATGKEPGEWMPLTSSWPRHRRSTSSLAYSTWRRFSARSRLTP